MRTIERTNAFLRDFKREKKGPFRHEVEVLLVSAISQLANDKPCRRGIAITDSLDSGVTIGSVTLSPTCC